MAVVVLLLIAACGYDYTKNRIPNFLAVLLAVWGAVWRLPDGGGGLAYIGQAGLTMLILYPFFKIGAIGAGDVKLLGVTAGCLPFEKIMIFLFVSLLIAAVISLVKMWKRKFFIERMRYLIGYVADVLKSGSWALYLKNEEDKDQVSICLAGPVLFSVLLYLGGVY